MLDNSEVIFFLFNFPMDEQDVVIIKLTVNNEV